MENKYFVFVVDDDKAVRDSLRWLIESSGYKVESYSSAQEFLNSYDNTKPGCLLLDVRMPGMTGPQLQKKLADMDIIIPIIFISAHGNVPTAVNAIHAGAVDFIIKPFDNAELLSLIDKSIKQDLANRKKLIKHSEVKSRLAGLTAREHEVMNLVARGGSNKQIATKLGISSKTVEAHRGKVMKKMGVTSLAELINIVLITDKKS